MEINLKTCMIGILGTLAIGGSAFAQAVPSATIQVDLAKEKAPVSATLHGIFMEEISHAFDGGLYAELIQNRSFEEGVLPPGMKLVKQPDGSQKLELETLPAGVAADKWPMPWPWGNNCVWKPERALLGWSLENRGGAKGEMKLTEANPMNAASSRSLAMTVAAAGADTAAVALVNSGYWGIGVKAGTAYDLKFHLRPGTFQGTVSATLESRDGNVLGRQDLGKINPGTAWQPLTARIQATGTDPQARFVLSFHGQGDLQVDWVSLFPPTFKDRPNGLRPELAQYLADLKPSFIRYPGGCYVEGFSWASAPDWRKMVCPPEERPGQWGYWQYRSTDGFGYHEFLQFCEDIGSDAMYVSFCGMTVHPENNMPLDQIDPVVQQTLDAIEYAIGPASSKWGAVRAKMGHPNPFPLKYVEIGNEHPPAIYGDYYVKFRQAIKAKYPQITVIMSMFWSGLNPAAIARAGDANIDIVDEHAYRNADWIRGNFDYFDKYPRKNWGIYVGEYASHHGAGDWYGGLGDSLYLMMCERNGDLVKMASYAPLFCNVNLRDWGINLIEFDSARSYAHASYYVQKLFAENRPDVNLATAYELRQKLDAAKPLLAGKFGLGSWSTQTEFKDLKITDDQGKVLATDDFQSLDNWEAPVAGKWSVADGVLRQSDAGVTPSMLLLKGFELKSGKATFKARRTGGAEGFLVFFNAAGTNRCLFANVAGFGNTATVMEIRGENPNGSFHSGRSTPARLENNRWYDVSLVVANTHAELFMDGKKVADCRLDKPQTFFANAGYDRKAQAVVLKATNYHQTPITVEIQLDNAATVGQAGKHFVIHSADPYAENSLDNPKRIAPRELPLAECAKAFQVTLPPNSVNILRIPATAQAPVAGQPASPAVSVPATPKISVGPGYYAILPGKLLLSSVVGGGAAVPCTWTQESGPGTAVIERPQAPVTWATAKEPGKYVFKVKAGTGAATAEGRITVNVYPAGNHFGNPLLPGMFPDPHILFDNGVFYIYATSMENAAGAYGRASVWQSKDFVNWEMTLTNWPVYGKFGGDIWAPDIIKKDGKYYQFITRSGGYDTWIAVADTPAGPWKNLREDNTPIVSGGGKAGRIVAAYNMDSNPFIDEDGQAYMYWGWAESMAAKLTPDLKNIDGDVHFLKGTKWLPNGGSLPQWLTLDLGESQSVTTVLTSPEFRHVAYGYKIELSDDNAAWTLFADRTANRSKLPGDGYVDTGSGKGRYVRITMTECGGNWAGLYNFAVYSGDKLLSLNKPATASSTRGKGSEPANAVDLSNGPCIADFVEGSYMIKRNGIYYLLYSSGALHDGSYSVHYAMGKTPFGPFTMPADNVVLCMNAEKTTKGPGHNSVLKFKDDYYIIYHQHNQPHEDAGGVFRQACADKLEFNADGTIRRVVPTQTGVGALQPLAGRPGTDIARGKYATATSVRGAAYIPEYALDHNNASKWRAADNQYPQTLTVDLGGTFPIARTETSFEYTTLAYKYRIETSLNGREWETYVDKTAAFPVVVSPQVDRKPARAAFMRITITGCERPENGAGLYSFELFQE